MPRVGQVSGAAKQRWRDLERLYARIRSCTKCPRLVAARNQPTVGYGSMRIPVMIVGLNPSRTGHNESGIPFRTRRGVLTPSGRPLIGALQTCGVSLEDLYFAELTRCHAPDNRPTKAEIENCRGYLAREIALLRPRAIVALGNAVSEEIGTIAENGKVPLITVRHPSYVQRFMARRRGYYKEVLTKILQLHGLVSR